MRALACRPDLERVIFADSRLGKAIAVCAEDARLAEEVFTPEAVSLLRESDAFKGTTLVLQGDRCHLTRPGRLDPETLDGLLDLLVGFHRSLPERLR